MPRLPRRVRIIALPESLGTPVHETLPLVDGVAENEGRGGSRLFDVKIVGPQRGIFTGACGLPLEALRSLAEGDDTDIGLMASMLLERTEDPIDEVTVGDDRPVQIGEREGRQIRSERTLAGLF